MLKNEIIDNASPEQRRNPCFIMRDVESFRHDNIENRTEKDGNTVACIHSEEAFPIATDVCTKHEIAME